MAKKRQRNPFFLPKIDFKNIPYLNLFYAGLILNCINIFFVLVVQKKLQPEVPLFYGLPEGQEQLTKSMGLIIPGVIAFAITLVNFSAALFSKREFPQKALILSSFVVSIFLLITVVKITLLIGSF